jgi:hypothetical protein
MLSDIRTENDGEDGGNGFNTKARRRTKTHGDIRSHCRRTETACTARSAVETSRGVMLGTKASHLSSCLAAFYANSL